jgi:hypothetical protein
VRALHAFGAFADAHPGAQGRAALEQLHLALDPDDAAIVRYAIRLTLWPRSVRAEHLEPLRHLGERLIHDVAHVVCCFSYMNRLADGTGVKVLPAGYPLAVELFGQDALDAHLAWAER